LALKEVLKKCVGRQSIFAASCICLFAIKAPIAFWFDAASAKNLNPPMVQRRAGGMSLAPAAAPLIRKADYFRERDEIEKALDLYTQAIKIDPKCAYAYIGRARVWEEFGKMDKALTDFTTAYKLDQPFNQTAARCRGDLYQSLHRFPEAIADYGAVIKVSPSDGLYLRRATCYMSTNKPSLALKDFDRALVTARRRASIYEKRGDAYLALNQYAKALADYDMDLKMDPEGNDSKDGHEHLHKSKAEIYKRLGKLDLFKKETAAAKAGTHANLDAAPFASDMLK